MLRIGDLDVYHGDAQALWGVSLDVLEGEICTLVGANGGGKTTLLRTICGLLPIRSGTLLLAGSDLNHVNAEKRVTLGLSMVPEGRRIFPSMTVEENLKIGAYVTKVWRKKERLLDKSYEIFPRLKARRRQIAGTLSGGERQMLAIGRALMSEPKILLLDEPSLGLAPKAVDQVMATIRSINEEGVTILLVEQNVNIALTISQRGYVIESGRIVLQGPSETLLSDPHIKAAYLGL